MVWSRDLQTELILPSNENPGPGSGVFYIGPNLPDELKNANFDSAIIWYSNADDLANYEVVYQFIGYRYSQVSLGMEVVHGYYAYGPGLVFQQKWVANHIESSSYTLINDIFRTYIENPVSPGTSRAHELSQSDDGFEYRFYNIINNAAFTQDNFYVRFDDDTIRLIYAANETVMDKQIVLSIVDGSIEIINYKNGTLLNSLLLTANNDGSVIEHKTDGTAFGQKSYTKTNEYNIDNWQTYTDSHSSNGYNFDVYYAVKRTYDRLIDVRARVNLDQNFANGDQITFDLPSSISFYWDDPVPTTQRYFFTVHEQFPNTIHPTQCEGYLLNGQATIISNSGNGMSQNLIFNFVASTSKPS